jgi:hypothetical protein
MSTNKKILIGILSFLPLILFIGYFVLIFGFVFTMASNPAAAETASPETFIGSFIGIFAIMGLMILLTFGLLIYFILHIVNNSKLDDNERLVWILITVFLGFIAYPIYWYVKIWKDSPSDPVV